MDSTAPVTRSEQEFLETAVLANRIGRLVFVFNFADKLDEEDREGLQELLETRLCNALGEERPPVFIVSAKTGLTTQEPNARPSSGLKSLKEYLGQLQAVGPQSREKALRFVSRAERILTRVIGAKESRISISTSAQADLEKQLGELEVSLQARAGRKQKIELWANERENELVLMIRGSLANLAEELRQEVEDVVADYKGSEFKHLGL
jgi:hypothetical protein